MSSSTESEKPNWLVFADDWGRHPSSCQYLIRELLDRVDVTWVDTIGMRTPRLDMATLRRITGKIRTSLQRNPRSGPIETENGASLSRQSEPNVLRPAMWPWFTRSHDRALNRKLLLRKLTPIVESWPSPRVLVTTIPVVADILESLPIDKCVYYCVDDFSVWPGLDQRTMLSMEKRLVEQVDCVIASSEVLQHRMKDRVASVQLLTHGVDLEKWNPTGRYEWPAEVIGERILPPVLFWGVVDPRLDVEFVTAISKAFPDRSVVFVGPQQDPSPTLFELHNVVLLPPVAPDVLALMAQSSGCLIMPYTDSEVTRAMQPLKLKEYLATHRPVVARSLPSTEQWRDACDVVASPVEFANAVARRLRDGISDDQSRSRERLADESWASKAESFFRMVRAS